MTLYVTIMKIHPPFGHTVTQLQQHIS